MSADTTYTRQDFVARQYAKGIPAMYIEGYGKTVFLSNPDRVVKVSDNEVQAFYGEYVQTITAEGNGDERHNFKSTIKKIEG